MMLPLLVVHKLLKRGDLLGNTTALAGHSGELQFVSQRNFTTTARDVVTHAAKVGFVYDAALRPTMNDDRSFLSARLIAGASGAATFATLAGSVAGLHRVGLTNPILGGIVSAVPAGLVAAEAQALSSGKILPTRAEAQESIGSLMFVGGVLGSCHLLANKREGTSRTNLDHLVTDQFSSTEKQNARLRQNAPEFKLLGVEEIRSSRPDMKDIWDAGYHIRSPLEQGNTVLFGEKNTLEKGSSARVDCCGGRSGDKRRN